MRVIEIFINVLNVVNCGFKRGREMTEYEKQVKISFYEYCLKYLRKPHWSWDILLRPLRIYYYSRKLKKLKETDEE